MNGIERSPYKAVVFSLLVPVHPNGIQFEHRPRLQVAIEKDVGRPESANDGGGAQCPAMLSIPFLIRWSSFVHVSS